jgi:peptidoglycan/xylan/chitin deacetylase (PgdA/CDA1 family)
MRRLRKTPVEPLPWDHVLEMHQAGMEIGSHAATHRNLAELPASDVTRELRDSKHTLEDRLGHEVPSLAYPFGIPGRHVTEQTASLAKASGYRIGASILYREVRPGDDPLGIPRFAVKNNGRLVLRGKVVGNLDVIGRRQERAATGST